MGTAELPRHVAVIMDGNGRWAREQGLPRVEGHRAGAQTVRMIVEESRKLGIRYLTLFAFSSENWNRPRREVSALMVLFRHHLLRERRLLMQHGIRLRAIGNRDRLPRGVSEVLRETEEATATGREMDLILAMSYGGRDEIVQAAKSLAHDVQAGRLNPEEIDEQLFHSRLFAPDVPDPDLLIRTSNEFRISNFLLWQLAYSELVVTPVRWPGFKREDFLECIDAFGCRQRRFGLTSEQVAEQRLSVVSRILPMRAVITG